MKWPKVEHTTIREAIRYMRRLALKNGKTPVFLVLTQEMLVQLAWEIAPYLGCRLQKYEGLEVVIVQSEENHISLGFRP